VVAKGTTRAGAARSGPGVQERNAGVEVRRDGGEAAASPSPASAGAASASVSARRSASHTSAAPRQEPHERRPWRLPQSAGCCSAWPWAVRRLSGGGARAGEATGGFQPFGWAGSGWAAQPQLQPSQTGRKSLVESFIVYGPCKPKAGTAHAGW